MKHPLFLPTLLVIGVIIGLSGGIPEWLTQGNLTFLLLAALVFQVGFGIGCRPDARLMLNSLRPKLAVFPLFTITGSLAFSGLAFFLLPQMAFSDVLAVGSGFGYYSLSSVLIQDMKAASAGTEAATVLATTALLSNILREVVALLLCGAMARRGKTYAAISVAGINSMDVCLPLISIGQKDNSLIPAALFHGLVLEISVPLLIGLFC